MNSSVEALSSLLDRSSTVQMPIGAFFLPPFKMTITASTSARRRDPPEIIIIHVAE
jgi:hypothetical protein